MHAASPLKAMPQWVAKPWLSDFKNRTANPRGSQTVVIRFRKSDNHPVIGRGGGYPIPRIG